MKRPTLLIALLVAVAATAATSEPAVRALEDIAYRPRTFRTPMPISRSTEAIRRACSFSGFSAGAYLTAMITLAPQWLTETGMDPKAVAGALPISGQMYTHGTLLSERRRLSAPPAPADNEAADEPAEDADETAPAPVPRRPVIDEAAPLFHAHGDAPPIFLFIGEQVGGRVRENRQMHEALVKAGHPAARFEVFPGRNHVGMVRQLAHPENTVRIALLEFIADIPLGNPEPRRRAFTA